MRDRRKGPPPYNKSMRILLIDNDDSFTRNLEHLLAEVAGAAPVVLPQARLGAVRPAEWDLVVLSPGPGEPADYPGYGPLLDSGLPVLGICLGLQIINEHLGGATGRLPGCVHGRAEAIDFAGALRPVARYHSLYLSRVAGELEVLAASAGGAPMAARHRSRPLMGYQFHPESFLTPDGAFFIRHAFALLGLS